MTQTVENHTCDEANADKFHDWILNRGGLFIWRSVNLSNPGASWTGPARDKDGNESAKPTWQCDNKPERHITKAEEVDVITAKELKRFRVATRMSGLCIKVTDGGTRKIRNEVEKASHGGRTAWYEFDYGSEKNCVIMIEAARVPLNQWVEKKNCVLAG